MSESLRFTPCSVADLQRLCRMYMFRLGYIMFIHVFGPISTIGFDTTPWQAAVLTSEFLMFLRVVRLENALPMTQRHISPLRSFSMTQTRFAGHNKVLSFRYAPSLRG